MVQLKLRSFFEGEYLSLFGRKQGNNLILKIGHSTLLSENYTIEANGTILNELIFSVQVAPFLMINTGMYSSVTYSLSVTFHGENFHMRGPPVEIEDGYMYTLISTGISENILSLEIPESSIGNKWRKEYPTFITYSQFPNEFATRSKDLIWSIESNLFEKQCIFAFTDCTSTNECYFCTGGLDECQPGTTCFLYEGFYSCQKTTCNLAECGDIKFICPENELVENTCFAPPITEVCDNGSCPLDLICVRTNGGAECQEIDSGGSNNDNPICTDSTYTPCGLLLSNGASCPGFCNGEFETCQKVGFRYVCISSPPFYTQWWFALIIILLALFFLGLSAFAVVVLLTK